MDYAEGQGYVAKLPLAIKIAKFENERKYLEQRIEHHDMSHMYLPYFLLTCFCARNSPMESCALRTKYD
jgi:hypothetical protein